MPRPRVKADDPLRVLFVPEDRGEPSKVFDFNPLPVADPLKAGFATAFAARTRASGRLRTTDSADKEFARLRRFAELLSHLESPPASPAQLMPSHIDAYVVHRSGLKNLSIELATLFTTLRKVPDINRLVIARMSERLPQRVRSKKASYSRAENHRILTAARKDVRAAAKRIYDGRELASRWRTGDLAAEPKSIRRWGEAIAYAEDHVDVRRAPSGSPRKSLPGTVDQVMGSAYLLPMDIAAFAVLLAGLTGENPTTIAKVPAAHHRPDGYSGSIASAIVELDKKRRGPLRHMDVPLVDLPTWIPAPSDEPEPGTDLRTAFGVYSLMLDLTAPARAKLGTERLFAWWGSTGGSGAGLRDTFDSEFVQRWSTSHALLADPRPAAAGADDQSDKQPAPAKLQVTLELLRLTFTELQQKPVAHTPQTLANEYLVRNRGNLTEYQKVVAAALDKEVAKAKTAGTLRTLSADEVAEAREHPARVAKRHGIDSQTLTRLLNRELDTVMTGCVDEENSPHSAPGKPCQASFMLCLSCPCARAAPHHLPVQVAVHDELESRRLGMTPARWVHRYAQPHAQLADLMTSAGKAEVDKARATMTDGQKRMAERFLNRELDHQ